MVEIGDRADVLSFCTLSSDSTMPARYNVFDVIFSLHFLIYQISFIYNCKSAIYIECEGQARMTSDLPPIERSISTIVGDIQDWF